MIAIAFTDAEIREIRKALSAQEDGYRRHGFKVLGYQVSDLRAKIADAVIDSQNTNQLIER